LQRARSAGWRISFRTLVGGSLRTTRDT